MNALKVSICIPAYKRPELMRVCLGSISKQTFTSYEVIITDDSPNNNVERVVNEFKNKIKNLKYYKNKEPMGSPENWNECIKIATGEYVKIIHCDDSLSDESSLCKYVKMLDENPNADFAFSSSSMCDKNGKITKTHKPNLDKINNLSKDIGSLFSGNFIGAPSATIHRKNDLCYDKNLKWLVDIDFYIMLLRKNSHFVFTEESLIIISSEGNDRVTNECINNKCVLFREYLYIYNKIITSGVKIKTPNYLKIFWNIISGHNIQGTQDLNSCGLLNKIPFQIKVLMMIQKTMNHYDFINKIKRKIVGIKSKIK